MTGARGPEPATGAPAWKRNIPVLVVSQLITVAAMSVVLPFIPFFVRELGTTDRAAVELWSGLIFSGPFLAAGLMSPVWGALGDRYGHKPMVVRAVAGLALVNFLLYFVQTPLQFWVLRLLQGMVTGFIPAALAITSATTPPEKLPDSLGKLTASSAAGRLVGPAVGGLLAGFLSFRHIFLAVGATITVALVMVAVYLREPPRATKGPAASLGQNLRHAAADGHTRSGLLALFVTMAAASMVMPVFPLFVEDLLAGRGDATVWTGLGFAVVAGFSMVGATLVGRGSERLGLKRLLVGGLGLTTAALVMHTVVSTVWALLGVRALLGLGVAGVQPVLISMIARRAPAGAGGGVTGLATSASIFGFFAGPFTGGWLANRVGVPGVFFAAAGITGLCALVTLVGTPRLRRDRRVIQLPDHLPR